MSTRETVRIEFLGCALTAWGGDEGMGEEVWLDVIYFADFLRGADGECAFCHGDPCAEKRCSDCGGGYIEFFKPEKGSTFWRYVEHLCGKPISLIAREFMVRPKSFETCPCCHGSPS